MDKLGKNIKRAMALMVAISMGGGVAFALHSKYGKTKTSDTVVNNVGKISNPNASSTGAWEGNCIYFGHYKQNAAGNDYAPIKWEVLDNNNAAWTGSTLDNNSFKHNVAYPADSSGIGSYAGRQNAPIGGNGILLRSHYVLDRKQYYPDKTIGHTELCWASNNSANGTGGNNKGTTLWAWLNGYNKSAVYNNADVPASPFFQTAFSGAEQSVVSTTKVYTEDASSGRGLENSARTSLSADKIFVLSPNEILDSRYGYCSVYSDSRRYVSLSNYAQNISGWKGVWLRSPGDNDNSELPFDRQFVSATTTAWQDGHSINFIGGFDDNNRHEHDAVVPAMNLDISKILFVSKADDSNKPSEVSSVPTAFAMPTGYGNEYKLTVKDSSRNFAIGNVTQNGKVAEISYSGAQTGNNEYISCIISDADDASDIKYYGKLDNAKSSGKVKIRIPDESSGYVIKLFNEQCNGANETDWASETQNLVIDNEGKVTTENYDVSNYAEVESIEIEPKSHSVSSGGPAENTTVILHGKNFSSNYKVTIEFRVDGVEGSVLSYPAVFSDASSDTLTVKIPKSEMVKLNDHIGRYTVEAKVESN